MNSALILLASLAAAPAPAASPDGCAAVVQVYLGVADATNRLLALEIAEHEAGVHNRVTSQRLVIARTRGELLRQSLASRGCAATAFTPAFSRYMPPARACAAVEAGYEPPDGFAGCDPLAWRS